MRLSPQRAVLLTVLSFLLSLFPTVLAQSTSLNVALTSTTSTSSSSSSSSSSSTPTSSSTSSTSTLISSSSTSSSSSTTTQPPLTSSSSSSSSSSVIPSSSSSTQPSSSSSPVSSVTSVVIPSTTSPPYHYPTYSISYNYITSTDAFSSSSSDSAAGSINTLAANNKGFLANKGAVGGTFTVVGLAALAIIGGLIFWLVKRHRRLRDEEEVDAYFEKPINVHSNTPGRAFPSTSAPAVATYDYFGSTGPSLDHPPDVSPFADPRPPSAAHGTAYAAALSQRGPYQYSGPTAYKAGHAPVAFGSNIRDPFADPGNRSGRSSGR